MILLPRRDWPAALADPRLRCAIDRRWLGYQVRRDAWTVVDRTPDNHRLWLAVEGVARLELAGRLLLLAPGAALWLPPGVAFSCAWPAVWRFHEVIFTLHDGERAIGVAEGAVQVAPAWELAPLIDRLADRARQGDLRRLPVLRHLLAATIAELLAIAAAPPAASGLAPAQRDLLERIVRERIDERLAPADLARLIGLSPDYFARRFRASFGCSPRRWLADERIRAAARLIHDGAMRPAAAAATLGFADLAQFSRRFRRVLGQPPRRWRRGV